MKQDVEDQLPVMGLDRLPGYSIQKQDNQAVFLSNHHKCVGLNKYNNEFHALSAGMDKL